MPTDLVGFYEKLIMIGVIMRKILIFIFAFSFFVNSSYAGITFWTTEVQPERMEKQKTMAKAFEDKTGISVVAFRVGHSVDNASSK